MEDGQLHKPKIGYIIQARMRSSRLPNKVLMSLPLGGGKPILKWITDALKFSSYKGVTYIATSINPENDSIENFCLQNNINIYRGDEEDVFSRFKQVIIDESFDVIIRLTGDNPIIDIEILDRTITRHIEDGNDYTKTEGLPLGMNFEIVNAISLKKIDKSTLSKIQKEHVTLIFNNKDYVKKIIFYENLNFKDEIRLTIDYPNDFLVLSSILSLFADDNFITLKKIQSTLKRYPWIFEANLELYQKKQFSDENEEIKIAIKLLKKNDLNMASKKLEGFVK